MKRAWVLLVALLAIGVSGCIGSTTPDAPVTTSTTETPATTTDDRPSASSAERPTGPDELTSETVGDYVAAYERAYRKQLVYQKYQNDSTDVDSVTVSINDVTVEQLADGSFRVTLEYATGVTTTTASGEERVADMKFTAGYHVDESTTLRTARAGYDSTGLHPVENGTTVPEPENRR